jgi:hypothetical protein
MEAVVAEILGQFEQGTISRKSKRAPRIASMHLVERYPPMDSDHLAYAVTIEDPKVFTRPWLMEMTLYRRREKNVQLLEYECNAFDDIVHLVPTTR